MTFDDTAPTSQRRPRSWPRLLIVAAIACGFPAASGCAQDSPVVDAAASQPGTAQTRTVERGTRPEIELSRRPGSDWPVFLGPHETGISDETGLLQQWPAGGPPLVWAIDVGTGYSAPSVRGDRLVLHHRPAGEEIIECFDAASGESLWTHSYPSRFRDPFGYNNGPRCTPLLTEDRCFTLGAEGKLTCTRLDDGEVVWQRDLKADFTIPDGFFGVGATPILEDDKLIVLVGGQPNSGVVAFDPATGKTLWEAVGEQTWDGCPTGWPSPKTCNWTGEEMLVSYSSPIAATIHGQRHLLCLMRQGLVSLDPQTGKERFHHWFMSRTYESVNAARPVVVKDTILLSSAYRVGSTLLKVQPGGTSYEIIWEDPRNLESHWTTPIHVDGYYYGFHGRHEQEGELRCLDAKTGQIVWKSNGWERGLDALTRGTNNEILDTTTGKEIPWPFYGRGSAILADGKFIVLAERGTLALVEATAEEWREIARFSAPRMKYPAWTAPVLSRGLLYLRAEDALVCLDLRARETP
jgi:outer membrane protein assembly factor BamB